MSFGKQELRFEILKKLEVLDSEEIQNLSRQVVQNLKSLFNSENLNPDYLGIYYPLDDEVNCLSIEEDVKLCFPFFSEDSNDMVFKESKVDELVIDKAFGKSFKIPANDRKVIWPEIILVPGVAFDKSGGRLGRGKGYYDRYLEKIESTLKRRVIKIGICFSQQLIELVKLEDHDQVMDFIVTDEGMTKVNQ